MEERNLSEAIVRELRGRVTAGRIEVRDAKVPALRLRISPTSASWSVYKRLPGSGPVRVLIGKTDDMTVSAARARAQRIIGEQLAGHDHAAEKRARRARALRDGLTLAQGWRSTNPRRP